MRAVQAAAKAAGVNIVLPIVERDDDLAYNSLVPITAQGEILKPYRKMFPVPGEAPPGTDNAAIELAGVPVAFSICYDVHFDEVYQAARDSGAKLVFWSSMWMGGRWLVARAVRYGFYIVSSTPNGSMFCRHGRNDHYGIPRHLPADNRASELDLRRSQFRSRGLPLQPCQLSDDRVIWRAEQTDR